MNQLLDSIGMTAALASFLSGSSDDPPEQQAPAPSAAKQFLAVAAAASVPIEAVPVGAKVYSAVQPPLPGEPPVD